MADKGPGSPPPAPGTLGFKAFQVLTRLNKLVYRATGGRLGGIAGMPLCILHHTGAKSGTARETPLTYVEDGENVILIASYGGAPKSPAWYFNLRAHPEIEVERHGRRERMTVHQARGEERERLWAKIIGTYSGYATYQERTDREIPVMVCEPRSP